MHAVCWQCITIRHDSAVAICKHWPRDVTPLILQQGVHRPCIQGGYPAPSQGHMLCATRTVPLTVRHAVRNSHVFANPEEPSAPNPKRCICVAISHPSASYLAVPAPDLTTRVQRPKRPQQHFAPHSPDSRYPRRSLAPSQNRKTTGIERALALNAYQCRQQAHAPLPQQG